MKENEMEKLILIEEIAGRIRRATTGPVLKGDGDRGLAKELIARIGKAYAEGLPLSGEVGRIDGVNWWTDIQEWRERVTETAVGPITFIALRQEKGGDAEE